MSTPKARLAARAVQPVLRGLCQLGHDGHGLLRAVGIDPAGLDRVEATVPREAAMAFWPAAVAATGDEQLGLHVAGAAPLDSFDVHGYALLSSSSVGDAFARACRYQRLVHDSTELTLTVSAGTAKLRHSFPGGKPVPRQSAEFLLATYVRFGRLVSGGSWSPHEVRFAHGAPRDTSEHVRWFRASLSFDAGENSLVCDTLGLELTNPRANPGLLAVLDRHANDLLRARPRDNSWSERVRVELAAVLCTGAPSALDIASRLGVSVRTLGRRLSDEGTTFATLLDGLRHERALALLGAERTSIQEVGFLLGFSELSAFYRAFRRWTGTTPAEYKKRR